MQFKTFYFVSLGCPKNLVDSEVMLGLLKEKNLDVVQDPALAEVIIVNTCSFIQASQEESIDTILELADYKLHGTCKVLVTSGCLTQRHGQALEKQLPEVDLFIGTGQYHRIAELLQAKHDAMTLGGSLPARTYIDQPAFIHTEKDPRILTGAISAYLKISEGCNRRCAFCIIPKLRGNVRSRSIASLVEEAHQLAAQGIQEINLVAQDLTEYGMEHRYKERLEMLLPELCKVPGLQWIRLHYIYPDDFSDELIDIIARESKIVKYLDMPIQHTQTGVLQRMNRRLTREKLFSLMQKLRERIPDIVFRTSIIVGFPGETDQDFQGLMEDLKLLCIDYVGVFRYSAENGTVAATMPDQVHAQTKKSREKALIRALQEQASLAQKRYIGKVYPVLLEGTSEETDLLLSGRLSTQAQKIDGKVLINDVAQDLQHQNLIPGLFVNVEITDTVGYDLIGKVVSYA